MKKIKKIFVYFLLIAIIVSNLTFNIYDIKTYALVETVVLSEEVIKAIILTLSGSAISSDLSDSQKLELYNSNKKSYMETVQFIIDNPDLSIEMIAEDQKENFMSACASLNFTASNIDEMNKYIDGSLAEQIEGLRDQFSIYSNNENPNDDDNNKFKNLLKRASALGGAIGIAAGSILSVIYGININNDNSDIICNGPSTDIHIAGRLTIVNSASIYNGYYWLIDHTENTNGKLSAGYFVNDNSVSVYTYDSTKKTINAVPNLLSGKYPFFMSDGTQTDDTYLGRSSSWKMGGYSIGNSWDIKCNVPVFENYADMKSYFEDDISVESASNYNDGKVKIPDNLDDFKKVEAQKWADVKNLIKLNPDKKEDVRGFIGIYTDAVTDLSKQLGTENEPTPDDVNEAVKKAVKKRLNPEYNPDIEPIPDLEPEPSPEPTPEPTSMPEPTLEPTPEPTSVPEPTPEPTSMPEPTIIPTPTPNPSQSGQLGGVIGDVFPFCIPFDLIYLVKSLKAEPTPPKWVIPFKMERLGIDEAIIIDFAQFEPIAKVCRVCFTILFILMLIMVSRKLIKG